MKREIDWSLVLGKNQTRALKRWAEIAGGWKQKLLNSQNLLAKDQVSVLSMR